MDDNTEFLLTRAREEAVRAINSPSSKAAEAHQELAVRYSEKAQQSLIQHADAAHAEAPLEAPQQSLTRA